MSGLRYVRWPRAEFGQTGRLQAWHENRQGGKTLCGREIPSNARQSKTITPGDHVCRHCDRMRRRQGYQP